MSFSQWTKKNDSLVINILVWWQRSPLGSEEDYLSKPSPPKRANLSTTCRKVRGATNGNEMESEEEEEEEDDEIFPQIDSPKVRPYFTHILRVIVVWRRYVANAPASTASRHPAVFWIRNADPEKGFLLNRWIQTQVGSVSRRKVF